MFVNIVTMFQGVINYPQRTMNVWRMMVHSLNEFPGSNKVYGFESWPGDCGVCVSTKNFSHSLEIFILFLLVSHNLPQMLVYLSMFYLSCVPLCCPVMNWQHVQAATSLLPKTTGHKHLTFSDSTYGSGYRKWIDGLQIGSKTPCRQEAEH